MNTKAKTIPVAIYPDGRRYPIHKTGGVYMWSHDRGSYPFSAAVENVEREGGCVVREPNPQYRPGLLPTYSQIMRQFGVTR